MNRRRFLIRTAGLGAAVGGAWWLRDHVLWRRPSVVFASGGTSGWLDYARRDVVLPTVDAVVSGRPVRALIDSGAQYSVIDRGLVERLGLASAFDVPLVAYGVGGGPQVGRGLTLDVAIGGARLSGLRTAILDLGPLAGEDGLATPLILGQDVLSQVVLELDTTGRHLRLVRPDDHRLPEGVAAVAVRKAGRALITEATVEGAVVDATIDTGSSSLLALTAEAAEGAGLLDGRAVRSGATIVLGGAIASRVVQARTVTFGDELYGPVAVPIYADVPLPGFPGALLGMAAFAGRSVVLDLGRGRLHLSRPLDLTVG